MPEKEMTIEHLHKLRSTQMLQRDSASWFSAVVHFFPTPGIMASGESIGLYSPDSGDMKESDIQK